MAITCSCGLNAMILVLHCCEQRIGCCRNACIVLFEKAAEHQDLQRGELDAVLLVQDGERACRGVQFDGTLTAEGLADKCLILLKGHRVLSCSVVDCR